MVGEEFSDHDKLVRAAVMIFSAYGFDVRHDIKGDRLHIEGNSGIIYRPDLAPQKGIISLICDVRTRAQRGTSPMIDRGAVQLLIAELEDLRSKMKRPQGIIISPHGIKKSAKMLADHFGIQIIRLPIETANRIISFDLITEKSKIINEAEEMGIHF